MPEGTELIQIARNSMVLVIALNEDIHDKAPRGQYRRYRMNDPDFRPFTFAHMIEEYIRHPEAKSLGPDGKPCTAETRGLLQRAHVTAGNIRYIDKETSSMWVQGDDLSVITDDEELGSE